MCIRDSHWDEVLPSVDSEYRSGYNLTKELLKERPDVTAIAGLNDMIAFGIIDALHEEKYRVPGDISVIGLSLIHIWSGETYGSGWDDQPIQLDAIRFPKENTDMPIQAREEEKADMQPETVFEEETEPVLEAEITETEEFMPFSDGSVLELSLIHIFTTNSEMVLFSILCQLQSPLSALGITASVGDTKIVSAWNKIFSLLINEKHRLVGENFLVL